MKVSCKIASSVVAALICSVALQAKQGATDPIPGTSKGTVKSGGGSTTPAPAPAPAPAPLPAITVGPLNFAPTPAVNGVVPVCTGDYRIDPYYPTLLDMTVNVSVSSLDVPDGTVLNINVVGTGGTLYPYTSSSIVITGGAGICSEKVFVTLGAGLAGVVITDAFGGVVFTTN